MIDVYCLRAADWEGIERDVVEKLRALHQLVDGMEPNAENNKLANEGIDPLIQQLAHFCASIQLKGEFIAMLYTPAGTFGVCQGHQSN